MVKKLEFRGVIEFARPETVFKYLYEDDAFIKLYHKEVNDDPNASATSWTSEEDGGRRREVTFKPRLASVPVLFRRYLGGDIAQLTEVQHCTGDGNTFTIRSELSTAVFGGLTLVTHGDTILSPAEKGCAIAVELTLELQTGLWWGLEGRVEAYAEEEARAVFRRWLNIARVFCEDKMGLEKEPLLKEEDSFHDVEDLGQQDSEEISTAAELNIDPITGLPNSPSLIHFASGSQDRFVQELWRNFRMAMRINHAKLQKVEREILLLRRSSWFFLKAWTVFGLGIATGLCLGFLYNRKLKRYR